MYLTYKNSKINRINCERKKLDWLWLTIVFLFSLNFLAKPNHLFIVLLLIGGIVSIYKKSTFKITIDMILIWLFSMTYYLILVYHRSSGGIGEIITLLIGPLASFTIGFVIFKANNNIVSKTVIALVLGNFIHGFLNMMTYFRLYGFSISVIGARRFPDIWRGIQWSATLQGTLYTLMVSLLFYSIILLIRKEKRGLSILLIMSIAFSLMASFIMGNRSLIVIMFISFVSNVILYSILIKKNPLKIIQIIGIIVIIALLITALYRNNILGIREFIEGSTWYMRSNIVLSTEDPRIFLYKSATSQMFDYPFGGYSMHLGSSSYVHNLWLDVLYATGLIPFSFLCWYTIKTIKNLVRLLKQKHTDIEFKIFIFSIYTGFLLNFMVEPILEGVPYMFVSFCLINGMIRKQIDLYKETYYKKQEVNNENTLDNKYSITGS